MSLFYRVWRELRNEKTNSARRFSLYSFPISRYNRVMAKTRLDLLLVERGLAETRSKAQAIIMAGQVRVNGQMVDRAGAAFTSEVQVEVYPGPRFISRGGVSGWIGTGEIFLLGCLMAWWVARTGSLRPSYVVHFVNNAAAFILAFLLPNLP